MDQFDQVIKDSDDLFAGESSVGRWVGSVLGIMPGEYSNPGLLHHSLCAV
jgi:hypothetical protein